MAVTSCRTFICDICGKEEKEEDGSSCFVFLNSIEITAPFRANQKFDLCNSCMGALDMALNNRLHWLQ